MTKAKAKQVLSALIDLNLAPTIHESGGDYTISVVVPQGATTAQTANVETTYNVTAQVKVVEFN